MIPVTKLWNNKKFKSLSHFSKLLYIYLATSSSINNVGVVHEDPSDVAEIISITIEELRIASNELIHKNFIYIKRFEGEIYFILPSHFSTVSKTDSSIEKIKSDIKSLPKSLQEFLKSIGISGDTKRKAFAIPTKEEVTEYALSIGYYVDGVAFVDFYSNTSKSTDKQWYDGRGKLITDWKSKLKKVWCKEDRKVIFAENAPKGFEKWVIFDNGEVITPEKWVDGLPKSKDFLKQQKLIKEFNKNKGW